MIKKYKHISFDLDGTLARTLPDYRYWIVPKVADYHGVPRPEDRAIDRFWFEAGRNPIIENDFGLDVGKFWDAFNELDTKEARAEYTKAYDDAGAALKQMKTLGKKISIITGALEWIAELEIGMLNTDIDHVLALRLSDFEEKPHPGSMHHTLEQVGHAPHETLYIGNSNEDAQFAKNAGCDFIYLDRGEHEFENTDWMVAKIDSLNELFW